MAPEGILNKLKSRDIFSLLLAGMYKVSSPVFHYLYMPLGPYYLALLDPDRPMWRHIVPCVAPRPK